MDSSSNEEYFQSYEELCVHELMIKDKPRTDTYLQAIESNAELIKGKVIMDVGAGTGILSLFAARAGAKKVHAIEASKMAKVARKIVQDNNLDHVIEVHECRVEDLVLDHQVDIIISEWMGFYLLHESMLNSVVYARDKFLKPNGTMFPCSAQIYAAAISMDELRNEKIEFWRNVYGFDFSSVVPAAAQAFAANTAVVDVKEDQILSNEFLVENIDLCTVKLEELRELKQECFFTTHKDGNFHAFCIWFDCRFPCSSSGDQVVLSTAPGSAKTHWQQFVVKMPDSDALEKNTFIESLFTLTQDTENPRFYNVSVHLTNISREIEEQDEIDYDFVLPGHEPKCDCVKCKIARAFASEMDIDQDAKLS